MKRIIALGMADAMPHRLLSELADELAANHDLTLDVHYMHGNSNLEFLEEYVRHGRIRLFCYFMGAFDRKLVSKGVPMEFIPCAFRDVGKEMLQAGVTDLYLQGTVVGSDLSFGSCCGYSAELATAGLNLHIEDNLYQPLTMPLYVLYRNYVRLVECNRRIPLHRVPVVTEVERQIAEHIIAVMPPMPTLQIGVGGVPNIVLEMMIERGLPVRAIMSELFSPAMVKLMKAGLLEGDATCTIAFGDTPEFHEFLEANHARIKIIGVEHTNNSEKLAVIPNLVSINSCLEVDTQGQVNSEACCGRVISGSGGQLDFVLGALRSPGGMSFLCMPSKCTTPTGEIHSRVVERLHGPVTVPRNCVDWVVTERGAVRLRGMTQSERCDALIGVG